MTSSIGQVVALRHQLRVGLQVRQPLGGGMVELLAQLVQLEEDPRASSGSQRESLFVRLQRALADRASWLK